VKDAKGKTLTQEHYELLRDLGIEIVLYDMKTYVDYSSSMHQSVVEKSSHGFEIYGSIKENVDFDALLELLKLLKIAQESANPAIADAFEHLKIVIGVADE